MASYFQSYLQASSMPKRLLQYALSRLEILETDALDLENLDIAWGKNSTFEFRDVGLRLRKLEDLLKLPPSLELNKARIILLRLTIPVDIYSSPIVVEVDGVEGQLRANSKLANTPVSRTDHDRNRKRSRPTRHEAEPGVTGSESGKRGSNLTDDDGLDPSLPTAADLAESFLQAEPEQERAELEAAMLSETLELGSASVMSEDGEFPVGTGAPLSLPGFMTRFLQGIVDRLEVRIQGITVNLDIDIPGESTSTPISNTTDPVTVQLKIDSVDIEGVTRDLEILSTEDDDDNKLKHKDGKRLISLSKICGALISEANLFSSLGRSSAMSSPSAAHSDISDRKSILKSLSTRASTLQTVDQTHSDHGSITSSRRLSEDIIGLRSLKASTIASDASRFDDASEDGEASNMSASLHDSLSEAGDSIFQNSAYLEELAESQFLDEEDSRARDSVSSSFFYNAQASDGRSTPKASEQVPPLPEGESKDMETGYFDFGDPTRSISQSMLHSTILPMRPHSRFSTDRVSRSQPLLSAGGNQVPTADIASSRENIAGGARNDRDDINKKSGDEEATTLVATDDLTKSQLFSHEDAESMYMSAISHASVTEKVPEGWSNSSGDSDGLPTTPGSPESPRIQKDSRDNLEYAWQHPATESLIPETMQRSSASMSASTRKSKVSYSPTSTHKRNNHSISHISSGVSERSTTSSDDYSRLTKQVLSLDRIDIYIPTAISELDSEDLSRGLSRSPLDDQRDVSQSTSVNIPGSFSTHIPSKQTHAPTPPLPVKQPAAELKMKSQTKDTAVEVVMGRLLTQFDISIGRLIFKIVNQLQELLKQEPSTPPQSKKEPEKPHPKTNTVSLKLCVERISLVFLERLEGTLGSAHTMSDTSNWVGPPEADILLQTTIDGLNVDSRATQSGFNTTITVPKFVLGYSQESIVSFDAGLQMRASVRDLKATDGIDLRVSLSKRDGTSRCEIITLPMHISIDLQKLDETFSWFGGLSSVLNLGSSIASNATITATNPGKPKTRGVRFEAPIKPDDASQVAQNKADIRLGGLLLDLVGAECSIGVETSAIKAVNRDEGMGIFVQAIRLSGPRIRNSSDEPAIIADIVSTRAEYLPSPKDVDLDRLLSLITPSKAQYDQDDDILLDTLLRQRKQGAVLRLTIEDFQLHMNKLDELRYLPDLGEEVSRLSTVAKYLPDDDRPGLLSLIVLRKLGAHIDVNSTLGSIQLSSTDIEVAHITLPSLVALSVGSMQAHRNASEELIGAATDLESREPRLRAPVVMARMIGDEMEPVVRIKLWNLKVEYRVPTLMILLGLVDGATTQDISTGLAESVATLTNFARSRAPKEAQMLGSSTSKSMALDVVMKDCILSLNPTNLPSKLLAVLTEGHLTAILPKDKKTTASIELSKASLLIIDDVANIIPGSVVGAPRRQSFDGGSSQVGYLCTMGFVSVSYVSSAKAVLVINADDDGEQCIDVEFRDDLFVLETCADSTQTLIAILNALAPPSTPSKETKYRTKVIPVEDLLASLSGDAFGTAEGDYNFDDDFGIEVSESHELGEEYDELGFDSHYYQQASEEQDSEAAFKGLDDLRSSAQLSGRDTHDGILLDSFVEPHESPEGELEFHEDHFGTGSVLEGTAHRWNSVKNTYDRSNAPKVSKSPLKVCVRDMHIIWNLFDGYDWQNTRDTISKAVQDVESKAIEKRARNERRSTFDQGIDDEETVIGDFLFNSIYIGIPANRDPRELAAAINQELNDNATETESLATTTHSSSPSRQGGVRRPKSKKLRLNRSKHHKITFELKGVNVDLVTFPRGTGETQSSVDVRVHDFEIFDHIPSSTWRKFATYMQDAGERETGSSMIHIELLNVKPIPNLAAAEIVLKVTVLPLRLHVDQDALDFITRFFEFKSDSTPVQSSPGDVPFIQRAEVNSVQVKLDFKPKRVDYAGLRSGHTTEFMNFLILDEADMVLRHTIIYGISGFDKLGNCLNDIWMPDVKRNQLPGILAGLAPVRSIVNVSEGIKHLVSVPVLEYRKDGRIVRSISKGATAFAKTTGTELVKLGAKVAIGVQTVLQGAEGFLGPTMETSKVAAEDDDSEEDTKHISLYANQPVGVLQGLRGGYTGLQRDLVLARDAIIAVPGEVMEGGNAAGLLRAVRKHAPTVILRPAIGVAKAGGQILMGATNSLDPVNLQRADAKYKKH